MDGHARSQRPGVRSRWAWLVVLASLVGCGARSEGTLDQRSISEGAPNGAGGAGGSPGAGGVPGLSLSLLASDIEVLPGDEDAFSFARMVVREGKIDVLANREGPPFEVLARRARVRLDSPFLQWETEPTVLMPGVVSGTTAAASGGVLAVCHHQFSGDDASLSLFTGAYKLKNGPILLSSKASCQGLAFKGDRGLLAIHARPPTGCCSRALLSEIDSTGKKVGTPPEQPWLALPEGEFGFVRVSDDRSGFAWVGLVDNPEKRVMVRFLRDGEVLTRSFPGDSPDTFAPQLVSWPSGDAVALSYRHAEAGVRFVAIDDQGALLRDEVLAPPPGERISRTPLASSPRGVVRTLTRCPSDFSAQPGTFDLSLLRETPEQDRSLIVPISCPAAPLSVVVVDDIIVVLLSTPEGLRASVAAISEAP